MDKVRWKTNRMHAPSRRPKADMIPLRHHLERALQGSRNSFGEIMALFHDMAMHVAMRHLSSRSLAEDAVQEAFLQAYCKLSQLDDPDAFPGWFRTILHRQCLLAKRQNAAFLPLLHAEALPADMAVSDPYTIVARRLDREQVRAMLDSLPDSCREACIQRYVYGRSYKEIAGDLGLRAGTVRRRLHDVRVAIVSRYAPMRERGIRVGYMPISDHLLIMAEHRRRNGRIFDIHPRKYLSWGSLARDLRNGTLDAALIMAPLAMALHNSGLALRYALDCHHDGSALTVRDDRPVKRTSGRGVKMALPHPISTHHLLLWMLHGNSGRPAVNPFQLSGDRDLSPQYISPSYVINSLQRRKIDGFFCSEPWSTKSVAQGLGKIVARSRDLRPGHSCCILVVREAFAKAHGAKLARFIDALEQTGEYLAAHPLHGARILTHYTGVDLDIAEHVLCSGNITFTNLRPDAKRTDELMRLALQAGILSKPCDLKAFMGR